MKTSRLLIGGAVIAIVFVLFWQARTIRQLHNDINGLRSELRVALQNGLDASASIPGQAGQARREQLELIKLRHQVREMQENVASVNASHGSKSGLRDAIQILVATTQNPGPGNIRPEWKGMETSVTNQYLQAMTMLNGSTNDYVRFLNLGRAAKMSFAIGRTEDARKFATDMLVLNDRFSRGDPEKANGDVVHDANLVLGRIALDEGRIDEAKRYLLAAGKSAGSPSLGSFGPNMSLARDLLAKGEQETALQYFEMCHKFWKMGDAKLDEWTKDITAGRIPDFGSNLHY